MPHGFEKLSHIITPIIRDMPRIESHLDIGAGTGGYGRLVRQYHPDAYLTGYECEGTYVTRYGLTSVYHDLRLDRAESLLSSTTHHDLVTMGDVIEHFPKSVGTDLLHHLAYRCKYLIIAYPVGYQQDAWDGHESEIHRSFWDAQDFRYWKHRIIDVWVGWAKQVVLIDGLDAHDWHISAQRDAQ